jgi:hypothetical protein
MKITFCGVRKGGKKGTHDTGNRMISNHQIQRGVKCPSGKRKKRLIIRKKP